MIIVTVHLASAISGRTQQLARMHICNDGEATLQNPRLGDYVGETFVGRDAAALAQGRVAKRGEVRGWRRHDFHIWNLVARMLDAMGYDKGRSRTAFADLPLIDDGSDTLRMAEAVSLLERGIREALPDAMIFASHPEPRRYRQAVDDMRAWVGAAKAFVDRHRSAGADDGDAGTAVDLCERVDTRVRAVMSDELQRAMAQGLDIDQAFTGVSGGVLGALLGAAWMNRAPGSTPDQVAEHLHAGIRGVLAQIEREEAQGGNT